MLELNCRWVRNCGGVTRRSMLTIGGLGALGLTLDRAEASPGLKKSEPNCIFVYLNGGPSQFETFDPKPEQSSDIRGPYGAIETNVSGIRISELLPLLSQEAHRYSLLRTFTHRLDQHVPNHILSGEAKGETTICAVATMVRGQRGTLPPFVRLGNKMRGNVGGGRLGRNFDPVMILDPSSPKVVLPDFEAPRDVSAPRLTRRLRLIEEFNQFRESLEGEAGMAERDASYQKAVNILTSEEVHRAFDLKKEPERLREAYGANKFGQSCLLARRLVEAGTRFVEIQWFGDNGDTAYDAWDLHGAELPGLQRMETQLCPRLDHGLSTLLRDLDERGLLDSTLVVAVGEFGRTPRVNRYGGRDHWPACQSVLLAGAGIPRGTVVGESDTQGAYPASRPVSLPDFIATIYHRLGLNPNLDDRLRPFAGSGQVVPDFV